MNLKNLKQTNKGITLIALVITTIVLLILAGVTIATLTGENGIFSKANEATEETARKTAEEKVAIAVLGSYGENGNIDYDKLNENLENIEGLTSGLPIDKLPATVVVDGYNITINADGTINFHEEAVGKGEWNGELNTPILKEGMKAVYWDENGNEINQNDANFNVSDWFDYEVQTTSTIQGGSSKWANAKTDDGSYWVWIPRFEYKITPPSTSENAGIIEVNFIPTNKTEPSSGYTIHPAFTNNIDLGGWDNHISGFWISKYEISQEISEDNKIWSSRNTTSVQDGNILTNDINNNLSVRAVSKPNVSSWRFCNIGNCYTNSYNYNRNLESHLLKNSEWGAVAYLTHSKYGRNGTEVMLNNSSSFITGNAANNYSDEGTEEITNEYNSSKGVLASTTGNIYGIYDMSGGAWEYVSAFNNKSSKQSLSYGSPFTNVNTNTKYVTLYSNETETIFGDFSVGKVSKTGDAIQEVWTFDAYSWFKDYAHYPNIEYPFFSRGGRI